MVAQVEELEEVAALLLRWAMHWVHEQEEEVDQTHWTPN